MVRTAQDGVAGVSMRWMVTLFTERERERPKLALGGWLSPFSCLSQAGPPVYGMVPPAFRLSLYPSVTPSQACPDSNPDIVIKVSFFYNLLLIF